MILTLGLLMGPVDTPLQAVTVGACAGAVASALAHFSFPGWSVFSAALAFMFAGALHEGRPGPAWPEQVGLAMTAGVAWVAAWPIIRFCLEALGSGFEPSEAPWEGWEEDLVPAFLRGLAFTGAQALSLTCILVWYFPSALALAFPAAAFMAAWGCLALPGVGVGWPLTGTLLAPLGAYAMAVCSPSDQSAMVGCPAYPGDLGWLPPLDAWMMTGLLVTGTLCGYWLTVWLQSLYYGVGDEQPEPLP